MISVKFQKNLDPKSKHLTQSHSNCSLHQQQSAWSQSKQMPRQISVEGIEWAALWSPTCSFCGIRSFWILKRLRWLVFDFKNNGSCTKFNRRFYWHAAGVPNENTMTSWSIFDLDFPPKIWISDPYRAKENDSRSKVQGFFSSSHVTQASNESSCWLKPFSPIFLVAGEFFSALCLALNNLDY